MQNADYCKIISEGFSRTIEEIEVKINKDTDYLIEISKCTSKLTQISETLTKSISEHEERIRTLEQKPTLLFNNIITAFITSIITAIITYFIK